MILLVTNKRDLTTDFIVVELRRRGTAFHRLNTEDLPRASVRFDPAVDSGWAIETADISFSLGDVGAAYYRRPGAPEPAAAKDEATTTYLADEWSAVTKAVWNALEGRWLSSPFAILRAEDNTTAGRTRVWSIPTRLAKLARSPGRPDPLAVTSIDAIAAFKRFWPPTDPKADPAKLPVMLLQQAVVRRDDKGRPVVLAITAVGPEILTAP